MKTTLLAKTTTIFSVLTMVLCVTIVILVIIFAEQRTVVFNANMVNELKNTISIGTNLGDFIACLYNAFGNYSIIGEIGKVSIDYRDLLNTYHYWSINNSFNDDRFNLYYYNSDRAYIETLPNYLTDTTANGWNGDKMFGFEVKKDPSTSSNFAESKRLTITKLNNSYIRMMLDEENFEETLPKLIKFHIEGVVGTRPNSLDGLVVTSSMLYLSYIYYVIIFKLIKVHFSEISLQKMLSETIIIDNNRKYKWNNGIIKDIGAVETFKNKFW